MSGYSIGELSLQSGVKVTTIRFYEGRGVLPEPSRSASGQRRYGEGAPQRLEFIRHARELGFELDDIIALASLADNPDQSCAAAHTIANRQLHAVERRLAMPNPVVSSVVCFYGKPYLLKVLDPFIAAAACGAFPHIRNWQVLRRNERCVNRSQ